MKFLPASRIIVVFTGTQPIEKHLFDGFVIGHQHVANGVTADEVADFLGKVLGVIAGAFERLGHEDDLQAGLTLLILGIFDVAEKNQIAQAIDFGVGAQHSTAFLTSRAEKAVPASVSIFSRTVAMWVKSRTSWGSDGHRRIVRCWKS